MTLARVLINYQPRLYHDLFSSILQLHAPIRIIEPVGLISDNHPIDPQADIIILPLDEYGLPALGQMQSLPPQAKIVAFSPSGDHGFRRLPGEDHWEEIRPFGLRQLLREVNSIY